jgi:ribosome modulation factor
MRIHRIGLAALVLLGGCGGGATISESQCYAGDWQTVGYRDGVNGLRSTQLLEHQDACVPHGVVPDRASYMAGWREGVVEYCEASNGFVVGEQGWGHNSVCPEDQKTDFERAYRDGRQLYLARSEVAEIERLIYQKGLRLAQIKTELVSSATEQLNPLLLPPERVELLARTQRLSEEKGAIERELPALEAERATKVNQLSMLQQSLASAY